ncbi:Ies3p [Saccharomyces cerevisiae P301]|nr:Ies3p [Saccharomyces cerevisiae P301]
MNYEMIKNSPGNVITNANQDEIDISTLKTRLYKDNLYAMNDNFLQAVNDQIVTLNAAEQDQETEDPDLSDDEKIDILTKIQENLLEEYQKLSQKERKWFILKELLLDANVELDLFSNRGRKASHPIAFGAVAIPTNVNANSLAFNRTKRRKINKNRLLENIL